GGVAGAGLEGAVAVAQHHRHRVVTAVGDRQVQLAVRVQVAGGEPARTGADAVALRIREGAVALAQEHAYRARVRVGHGQVGAPVPVEVRHDYGSRFGTNGVALGG